MTYYVAVYEYAGTVDTSGVNLGTNYKSTPATGNRATLAVVPTLTSPTATSIGSTTATLGANVTSDGGAPLTARGTCWGTSAAPTANCVAAEGTPTGAFTQGRTGLTAGIRLYYRGYATNSAGTGYSPDGSFYTEPATQASGVTFTPVSTTSMTVGWTRGSGSGVIVLMSASSPVDSDPVDGTYSGYTASTAFGGGAQIGTGNYVVYRGMGTSVTVTGLTTGTSYYVAVYEYAGTVDTSGVNQGTNYKPAPATGSQLAGVVPTVTSPTATLIGSNTATIGATVTADGGNPITARGTCWATTATPRTNCVDEGGTGVSSFTQARTGLPAGTRIYYAGYATNAIGTGYSSDGSFYTEPATQASGVTFTSVTQTGMTVNWTRGSGDGVIVLMQASSAVATDPSDGTYTGYTASPTFGSGTLIGSARVVYKSTGTSVPVTNLAAGTTYHVAVYEYAGMVNTSGVNQGTNYKPTPATGNQLAAVIPTLTTPTATSILDTTATLGATVTANGGNTLTARGTCWDTTASPRANCVAEGGTGVTSFTQARTGLPASTRIYYAGYATNAIGTGYSSDGSFYTEPATQASGVTFTSVTSTGMTVNWTRGSGDGVIVLMQASSAVATDPSDGTYTGYTANPTYGSGTLIGSARVVYKSTGTSVAVTGLTAGTTYYVAVYQYAGTANSSGVNQGTNYRPAPATGSRLCTYPPTLTSPTATSIVDTTAMLGATVTASGGATLTARGTCWDITASPRANCVAEGGTGVTSFTQARTGLPAGTHVYHAGYATNSAGTGYSPDGSFYTEPATQASGVTFTSINSTTITVNWTRGSGGGVIVLMRAGSAVAVSPSDGTYTGYTANTKYGSGTLITSAYVVYKGTGTSVEVTGLTAGTTYHVAVYEYAGTVDTLSVDQGTNYKPAPATGSQLTQSTAPCSDATAWRSIATGNWGTAGTWECQTGGAWRQSSSTTPSGTTNPITIRSGNTVTVGTAVSAGNVTIDSGGQVTVTSTWTIAEGTGTDLTMTGTLVNSGTMTMTGTAVFNAGSLYQHSENGGTIPTVSWDANSTCLITGTTYTVPGGLAQAFGNLTWNATGQYTSLTLGSVLTVAGNLTVQSTGSSLLTLAAGTSTVTGNYSQTGGTVRLATSSTARTLTVGGNFSLSSGTLTMSDTTVAGTVNVAGNYSQTGGTITETSSGSGAINFTGSGTHTFVSTGTVTGTIAYTVGSDDYRTVAANSSLGSSTATLTVNGTFDQGCSYSFSVPGLTTVAGSYINCNSASAGGTGTLGLGGLTVSAGGTFDFVGTGTMTLTGNVSNAGVIRINGGGRDNGTATCGGSDTPVSIYATANRTWATGSGHFYLADVALTRQVSSGGAPLLYGNSSKDSYSTGWGAFTTCGPAPDYAPTLVRFGGFSAVPQDGGVLLTWRTGHEVNNLGFHVYRDGVRVTASPIAGSALLAGPRTVLTAGNTYRWVDPEGMASSVYTLEDVDLDGTRTLHGPVTAGESSAGMPTLRQGTGGRPARDRVAGSGDRSRLIRDLGRRGGSDGRWFSARAEDVAATEVLTAAEVTTDVRTPATVTAAADGMTAAADAGTETAALSQQYALARGPAVKLGVRAAGWYHVDASTLTAAGMPAYVNPLTLRLFVHGAEQALQVTQQAGVVRAIEFYGTGVDTAWADTQVYWLTWGSQVGQRVGASTGRGRGTAPTSFPFTVQWKPRLVYFAALQNGDVDNFFGPVLDPTESVTQALPVAHVSTGTAGMSTLQVKMQGVTTGTHVVLVSLNGAALGSLAFQDKASGVASFTVANASLAMGATLTLTAQGGGNDVTLVDTVALTYPHLYVADSDALRCTALSGQPVLITGFSMSGVRVMDVTDPASVTAPQGTVALQGDGNYGLSLVPQGGGTRTLLAFTPAQLSVPASVGANQPSSWHAAQPGADLVIASHSDFLGSLAPLVALRQSQGLKVAVVNVEDLYDEFNFGVPSPSAVKAFLATAAAGWTNAPRWGLLVGDATADPRDYLDLHQANYVPAELVATTQFETASDDWFGDLNDDGVPEVAIGRLPVQAASEAAALVAKLVAYDAAGAATWKNQVLLAAGTNDAENDFDAFSDTARALLPTDMTVTEVKQGSDPAAAATFLAAFNQGQGLVNYIGHGSTAVWQGDLFTAEVASTVANGAATPFVLAMTCLNGYFQDPGLFSLSEALLEAPGGGAVGVWASSGLTESPPQAALNQAFLTAVYGGGGITVGEAAATAKGAITDLDVRRTWNLFGDPSMKLR